MVRTLDGLDLGVRAQLHVRRAEERRAGVPARYSEDDVVHLVLDEGPRDHDADVAVELRIGHVFEGCSPIFETESF